ncbi:MAG: hypothetical protein J0L94_04110 [Rhodothermia bacterium]|nr:hypothetical protein [Rhodothermia bacterium]
MKKWYFFITAFLTLSLVQAQSPPDLDTDITWSAGFATVSDIATAFNAGRRGEETQKSLTTNILGSLTMPSQATWDAMSINEKGLYLVNAERIARAGVNYGGTVVKGLPLEGVNTEVTTTSQSYADYLISVNQFSHNATPAHPLGSGPFDRVANTIPSNCREFISYSENLAAFWTSGSANPLAVERAVYGWIYDDSISSWGHRRAVLVQDYIIGGTSGDATGFDDNYGATGSEGFIGFGIANGASYNPFSFAGMNMGTVVVMMIFDPYFTCTVPLPITLTTFMGQVEAQQVTLKWETASEANFDGFWVEMAQLVLKKGKTTLGDFKPIAYLPSKGSPDVGEQYAFQTNQLQPGIYFFRLKNIDKNGRISFTQSQRIEVNDLPEGFYLGGVFPNPFRHLLNVDLVVAKKQALTLQIIDVTGRQLYQEIVPEIPALTRYQYEVNLSKLPLGRFFLVIKGENFSKTVPVSRIE